MADEKTISFGSLYEANQSLMKNELCLPREKVEELKKIIVTFMNKNVNHYYMCLCKEVSDYTIFTLKKNTYEKINETVDILIDECMYNRGSILHIDNAEDGNAIEIWLRMPNEEVKCYYFFGYDSAIIEV